MGKLYQEINYLVNSPFKGKMTWFRTTACLVPFTKWVKIYKLTRLLGHSVLTFLVGDWIHWLAPQGPDWIHWLAPQGPDSINWLATQIPGSRIIVQWNEKVPLRCNYTNHIFCRGIFSKHPFCGCNFSLKVWSVYRGNLELPLFEPFWQLIKFAQVLGVGEIVYVIGPYV